MESITHQPDGYLCPFCGIVRGTQPVNGQIAPASDVVYSDGTVTAFLGLGRWEKNPVDVLVVPNKHYENLFDLPIGIVPDLHRLTRAVALALKAVYRCDGISTRQHNEPAGDQDVWHYHIHVTPRFSGDHFYQGKRAAFPEVQRLREADSLRQYMAANQEIIFRER
jgi:histidine triad (HIT) family protein